jgi:ubiquinone/menaquinone biosynthesis C-methylase UbiE
MTLSRNETKALYDKISKVYDLLSEHTEAAVRETGLGMLAAQPGETVLEIGFGTGHALVWLARAVGPAGKVHGIDLSDGMLAVAEDLLRRNGVAGRGTADGRRYRFAVCGG